MNIQRFHTRSSVSVMQSGDIDTSIRSHPIRSSFSVSRRDIDLSTRSHPTRSSFSVVHSRDLHTHYEYSKPILTRRNSSTEFSSTASSSADFLTDDYKSGAKQPPSSSQEFTMRDKGKAMVIDGIGKSWKIKGRIDAFGGRAVLQENGQIIAVVIRERCGTRFEYKLLGITPLYPNQKPHSMTIKNHKLYEHVIVRKTGYFSNNFIILGLCDNVEYVTQEHSKFGPLQLKVLEKKSGRCCGLVKQYFERDDVSSSSWQVRVEKGINPKIMICLTAIANKSMGKCVL